MFLIYPLSRYFVTTNLSVFVYCYSLDIRVMAQVLATDLHVSVCVCLSICVCQSLAFCEKRLYLGSRKQRRSTTRISSFLAASLGDIPLHTTQYGSRQGALLPRSSTANVAYATLGRRSSSRSTSTVIECEPDNRPSVDDNTRRRYTRPTANDRRPTTVTC